ncbi:IclR family transcriptional regulator [Nitratireductor sp.]|uniref:IclR family transcriptional regulator n=1 Tax=Nitratireductor sp. TaxID=1872084 RepID=UPI0025EEEF6E|nr:IclR family transcriptional regulator [Nitratireductor sp.]
MRTEPKQSTLFVASIEKGMRILSVFGANRAELSLTELSEILGVDKSTVQRFTYTFQELGYLDRDPETKRFRPSLKLLELSAAYLWSDPLIPLAMPKLVEFSRALGERVNAARLNGSNIVFVIRIPTQMTSLGAMLVGKSVQALSTSSGRILVAHLSENDRKQAIATWPLDQLTPCTTMDRAKIEADINDALTRGYGMTISEGIMNEIGIAAPVFNTARKPVATVQCSVSSLKWKVEAVRQEIAPRLIEIANSIVVPR